MKTYFVPLGRMKDYPHEAPERTAYKIGKNICADYKFTVFPSREFMKNALRKGGMKAVVMDRVNQNIVIYPAFQKAE